MSERVVAHAFADAQRVPVWTKPAPRRFAAVPSAGTTGFSAWGSAPAEPEQVEDVAEQAAHDSGAESLIQQGYALGLAEGRRMAEATLAEERAALARLVEGLEALQPEPPQQLASLLAASVRRLVAQIVGEVEINEETLTERTQAVAALIVEDAAPSRLRVHPDDAGRLAGARLDLEIAADPTLAPGSILLETSAGWIEDGPAVRLEKLRTALDRMGAPR